MIVGAVGGVPVFYAMKSRFALFSPDFGHFISPDLVLISPDLRGSGRSGHPGNHLILM